MSQRINVTKAFLPPIAEFNERVAQIWENDQLTNQGPLVLELERELKKYLGVENFHFVSNGTTALQLALRALDITDGEIITTPFSYVATTSSILWEHCEPVYVDIDPDTLCIDSAQIEATITPRTKAIMPVHVFGNPCDVEKIDAIAKKHNLKVIYDAAHAFGATHKGKSLYEYGDIAIGSFHATKLFHTIEGGCMIAKDKAVSEKIELLKRFGHNGDEHIMLGINAKASEFQAAMGLCNLKYIDAIIAEREQITAWYDEMLPRTLRTPNKQPQTTSNYAYYPVICTNNAQLMKVMNALQAQDIFPRRYFYPSLNLLPYLQSRQRCPHSEKVAESIMCLPLYSGLDKATVVRICKIIQKEIA